MRYNRPFFEINYKNAITQVSPMSAVFLVFFAFMLIKPSLTVFGAQKGLLLWYQTLLPTLLPYMIFSNLIIRSNAIHFLTKLVSPTFCKVFRISENGCFAALVGFLCGYPMGAKTIADLILQNKITKSEGAYLLSFCNNASPSFIINYLILQNFKCEKLLLSTLLLLFGTPIFLSFVFRRFYPKDDIQINSKIQDKIKFEFISFDQSIMNAFENITKVGGYVILFSILASILSESRIAFSFRFIIPLLEITNAIPYVMNHLKPFTFIYPFLLGCVSFGGICSIAQTKSMISKTDLKIGPYIIQKLITAMATSLFAFIYIQFIHR